MEKLSYDYIREQYNKNFNDLIGKSLKIVYKGARIIDPSTGKERIDCAYIRYLFDIESVTSEQWKAIDFLNGTGVYIEFWSENIDTDKFALSPDETVIIDFQNKGELEKEEFYLIDKEEGLAEIDRYYRQGILRGII